MPHKENKTRLVPDIVFHGDATLDIARIKSWGISANESFRSTWSVGLGVQTCGLFPVPYLLTRTRYQLFSRHKRDLETKPWQKVLYWKLRTTYLLLALRNTRFTCCLATSMAVW